MRDSDLILNYSMFITLLLVKELVREGRKLCLLIYKKNREHNFKANFMFFMA